MSFLSNPAPYIAARMPIPSPYTPLRNFRRQQDYSAFICNGKYLGQEEVSLLQCPSRLDKAWVDCLTGGTPRQEWEANPNSPIYADKKHCTEYCNGIYDGSYRTITLDCLNKQCEDGKQSETLKNNVGYINQGVDYYKEVCTKLGLTEVVADTKTSSDKVGTAVKTDNTDKTKTTDQKETKTDDTGSSSTSPPSASSSAATESASKDSGSARLRIGGWKGTSAVVALVIGSISSGLWL